MRLFSAAVLTLAVSGCAFGQTYTIKTFAGGGLPVHVAGTSATLRAPGSVAVDGAGNLFFSDERDVVLRLDAKTGVVTVAAGNGTSGFSGDNGPAASAQLFNPRSVAVDVAGNLYIADWYNHLIRKVSKGVITTVAGNVAAIYSGDNGPATSAQLENPNSVAVDAAGNLYIADSSDHRIRKVSTGVITTVAGNGTRGFSGDNGPATSAQLWFPLGVTVDAAGNLYIADCINHRVRKVSNGTITTVAGSGVADFKGDNGPATSAQLNNPRGVAVDAAGNLYIADSSNHRIRKVSNGTITTVAGDGTEGFGGDNGPAIRAQLSFPTSVTVDAAGNLYFADRDNNRIRKVSNGVITTLAGGGKRLTNGPATNAQLNAPEGVAVDAGGNLYIADCLNQSIRKVTKGVMTTVAGSGSKGFSGDQGPATSAQLFIPFGVAADAAGNLYIADRFNHRIRKVSNGVITTVAGSGTEGFSGDNGPATSAQLSGPSDVTMDAAGNLYIADSGNDRVRKVSNGVITSVAGSGVADFSGDDGPATSAQLNVYTGIAVDAAGNIYIADKLNHRIRKVSQGVITTVAGSGTKGFSDDDGPATWAQLNVPQGVAVDAAGNLFIADTGNHRIRKVSNGVITTVAGSGEEEGFSGDNGPATSAPLSAPQGIALDAAGNLYIADPVDDRIRVLIPSSASCSASVTPLASSPAAAGGSLAVAVQTGSSCAWAIQSLPEWITFTGSAVATGPGKVTLSVAANSGKVRAATVSIAGVSVPVTQQGTQ